MTAANTDLLKKVARKWVGQIGAGGVADDTVTTIPLASATNLPTDTAVTVVIDRVDANGTKTPSSEESITGVVSGSNIISAVRGVEGTAQAHDAGAVVEVLLTADHWNEMIDWALVQHLQDGNHGDVCATSMNLTASGTYTMPTAGKILDANANELLEFTQNASAVNNFIVANAATGNTIDLCATGGDTNIDMVVAPKGAAGFGFAKHAYFTSETDNGNSGTADTIDWNESNKQKSTLTDNVTFTFTAPSGACNLTLKLVQDGTGSRTATWPASVKWTSGTAPTLSTAASSVDIVSFYYDGTNYHGQAGLNFS